MKYIHHIFVLLAALLFSDNAFAQDDWANIGKYDAANKSLLQKTSDNKRVVFMGNSITEVWMNTHPNFFNDNNYVCRGISGQTTYQFLVRFREDVVNLHPDIVVIIGGTNDIAENNYKYDENRTLGNIQSMIEIAQANGIKVILGSVLPSAKFYWHPNITNIQQKIEALNKRLKSYANANNIIFADFYPAMVYGANKALNPTYSEDGVHPVSKGFDVMESIIVPLIKQCRQE